MKRKIELEKNKYIEFETICINNETESNNAIKLLNEENVSLKNKINSLTKELIREKVILNIHKKCFMTILSFKK